MPRSELVGYVRLSKNKKALHISLCKKAVADCKGYNTSDSTEYVALHVNVDRLRDILDENREVTSVCFLQED